VSAPVRWNRNILMNWLPLRQLRHLPSGAIIPANPFANPLPKTSIEVIDLESLPNTSPPAYYPSHKTRTKCEGFLLRFPSGQTAFSSYPFGLHDKESLPWEIGRT
jgi:hypothetical protein